MAEWARQQGGSSAVVKVESPKEDGGRARREKAHPLAGRRGEGPPIAPPGWVWRAGNRARDMYFVSPTGEKFRSQLHLHAYLTTLPNAPPMALFRWKVNLQEFEYGVLPGVIVQDRQPSARKKARLDGEDPSAAEFPVMNKAVQSQHKVTFNSFRNPNGQPAHLCMKFPDMIDGSTKTGQRKKLGPDKINAKESDNRMKKETSNASFRELLFTPTSYKVLSKNEKVLQRFLTEAVLLKEKDEKEIEHLRNELLLKKYNPAQLSKYPESVLRVFFYILRNEEAPATIEKGELIELCTYWICKHKHHWCLLETRRLNALETLFSNTLVDSCRTLCRKSSTLKENTGHFVQGVKNFDDWKRTHDANGIPDDCATGPCVDADAVHGFISSKRVIESTSTENEVCFSGNEEALKNAGDVGIDGTGRASTAADYTMNVEDSCRSKQTIHVNPGDSTPRSGSEHTKETRLEHRHPPVLRKDYKPHTNKCNCQVCSSDPTFCYGCTCTLCKVSIQHNQTWTFLNCPICQHFCHLECALKTRRAGVVVELGMDGEYLCSCSNKSDLVPFWAGMLKSAVTSIDRSLVQKYLTSAVLVFNGTQRETIQSVHQSVIELHDSLLYNTPCTTLQQILRQIQEKVNTLNSCRKHADCLFDAACVFDMDVEDRTFLQEEEKLPEALAQAELHYVEWLMAEKNADTQRMNLRIAHEEMEKAELDINTKAVRARSSQAFTQQAERRLQLMKRNIAVKALSREQLKKQRAALELELVELNKVRNQLGSFSAEPHEISAALHEFKIQSKRVDSMKARLQQIDSLNNFFS